MDEKKYWLAFLQISKIGPANFMKILSHFGNMKNAWHANLQKWRYFKLPEEIVSEFFYQKNSLNPDDLVLGLEKEQIKIVTILDPDYPHLLKEVHSAPPILFYKGKLPKRNDICLGVVGARKISQYGTQAVNEIVSSLAKSGVCVVSGLALGVDASAHKATLNNSGKTVAILGSGIDEPSIYPKQNLNLAREIVSKGGCVMSEYPPKTGATKYNFPARNRIISGISVGSLIIEADIKSGSLITAQYALDQNREVYAVPGSIYSSNSRGTNNLIKQGAKVTTEAQDIIEDLNIEYINSGDKKNSFAPESGVEESVYNCLSHEPMHIDQIVKQCKLETPKVSSALILLEMRGGAKNTGGMNYIII